VFGQINRRIHVIYPAAHTENQNIYIDMPQNFAATRPVNPPGAEPKITAELLWKGLERKARDPKTFIPAVTSCEVLKDEGNKASLFPSSARAMQ